MAIANHQIFTVKGNKLDSVNIQLAQSDRKTPLFRFIFALHSGEILGLPGILLMDILAIGLIFFCLSGLYQWVFPKVLKRATLGRKTRVKGGKTFRFLFRYHNLIGLVLAPLLIISSVSAMVMRPPGLLLISSADSPIEVSAKHASSHIPYKITKAVWYKPTEQLFLLTDDGVYQGAANNCLGNQHCSFVQMPMSTPVHGMGATIFQPYDNDTLLIGSFSGLYRWQPEANLSSKVELPKQFGGLLPMAAHSNGDELVVFDYFRGKVLDNQQWLVDMPVQVNESARMGLWNFFFELHNIRIFQHYIGPFYLILLLVIAIALFTLTITGVLNYLRRIR